jgi:GxxExxY protein
MIRDNFKHSDLSKKIMKAYYNVYNNLGHGFLGKVYEKAMIIELKKQGLECETQKPIDMFYDKICIGSYFADIIVENKVIIELKACEYLIEKYEIQLVNYLKATEIEVGLLLNFRKEVEYKRKVLSNDFKRNITLENIKIS